MAAGHLGENALKLDKKQKVHWRARNKILGLVRIERNHSDHLQGYSYGQYVLYLVLLFISGSCLLHPII